MQSDSDNKIFFYEREFYVFSNFSSFIVEYDGYFWPTSEYAYQAQKFTDVSIINQIKEARSSHDAFKIARAYEQSVRADWLDVRVGIMEKIVREKLQQHEYVQKKLLETGDKEIIEDSPRDPFWGWGPNKDGENQLGNIWMRLREELKSQAKKD